MMDHRYTSSKCTGLLINWWVLKQLDNLYTFSEVQ